MTAPNVANKDYSQLLLVVQQLSDRIGKLEEKYLQNTNGWAGQQTNVTPDRAFNADTVAVAELADVVGTLIADLIEARVLS
jgi:hypothetical protein